MSLCEGSQMVQLLDVGLASRADLADFKPAGCSLENPELLLADVDGPSGQRQYFRGEEGMRATACSCGDNTTVGQLLLKGISPEVAALLNLGDYQWWTADGADDFLGVVELVTSDVRAGSSSIGPVQQLLESLAANHPSCLEALQELLPSGS